MDQLQTPVTDLHDLVYTIRGTQVMPDSDLAMLYGYDVKRLNEQVKRNKERFPDDFMFQLTADKAEKISRSHFATLKIAEITTRQTNTESEIKDIKQNIRQINDNFLLYLRT